ncbi:MAG: glutathione S-transferase [Chromatiales bacterium]|jgi:glutathione S-transferase|nr:glutathione S-transferase [Chromatiales bacterium]
MSTVATTLPILYSFRRCPYAMRARMALMNASVVCDLREVVLRNKPPSMLALSAKGTVPVLQLTDGTVIDESLDVMEWALAQADPGGWLEADLDATRALIDKNDSTFKAQLDRYKYFVDYPEQPQEYYRDQASPFLSELENLLGGHQGGGLAASNTTFADVAIFPFIRQFARVNLDWFQQAGYDLLNQWFDRFEKSSVFLSVMNKYPRWQNGDATTLFGART